MPLLYPAPTWSPHTSLPGLLFCADWTRSTFQDAARATAAAAIGDVTYWWGGLKAIAADATRPLLAAGPTTGRLSLTWDGSGNRPLYQTAPWFAGKALTLFAVYKFAALPAGDSRIVGRGEYTGNGTCLSFGADGIPRWHLTTAGASRNRAVGSTDLTGQWVVQALSYDGTTGRCKVRGQTMDSDALDGTTLTFDALDVAAWVGGSTQDGSNFAFYDAKTVALWGVTADVFTSDAALTVLVNNLAAYAGVP